MIDIIIPVYNTPLNDLERCLNSIMRQTYKDYMVYIIDDGSNDITYKYLDNYVKDNDKYIVKHIKNNCASNARNIGISISNSKYIAFVDADDTINENFLEEAYRLIEDYNLDVIIGGYNEIDDNKIVRTRQSLPGLYIYDDNNINNFLEKLLSSKVNDKNKEIGDCPTGRIYTRLFKRNSINKIRFNTNIHMSEDTLFMIDFVNQAKRIGIVNKIWYNYYINKYSISRGTDKELLKKYIEDFIKEIKRRKDTCDDINLVNCYQSRIDKANNYIKKLG